MLTLATTLTKLPNLGTVLIKRLRLAGVQTVGDLLYYFPSRYEDFSKHKTIQQLSIGETVTIKGQVLKIKTTRTWKRKMTITEVYVDDGSGVIKSVWFNYPGPVRFLSKGKYVQLSGKVAIKKDEPYLQHPNLEMITRSQFEDQEISSIPSRTASTGGIAPVYPETKGITTYLLRRAMKVLLDRVAAEDFIPSDILQSQKLLEINTALRQVHFPQTMAEAENARSRFAFEKMFLLQIKSLQVKLDWEQNKAVEIKFDQPFIKDFVSSLPFQLTSAQKKSAWQIIKDLERTQPMNRLLEGDVGSGKTMVAALSLLSVVHNHYQTALLSPTEVLSIQHYNSLVKLFENLDITVGILTASQSKVNTQDISKKELLKMLSTGKIDILIGTHALLQEKVRFKNLALVIIDEQHRFGVNQRAFLQQQALNTDDGMKEVIPHLLTMTATPIPRTLSLALFGNLDLSIIDEFPKGRKPIITKVIPSDKREQSYKFIKKQIAQGRQVFIICPLIEESSKISEVKAATQEYERLQKEVFKDYAIGLMHGKLKPKEKDAVMRDFKEKKYDILVSTSVVEVGVDVPNATIMLIEGAERFGLSQLHQFRGRVGRGEHQSYCFLFTSNKAPETTSRLKAMQQTNDGFKIAEHDLRLRGPGQFLGTMQSGTPDIAMESLTDIRSIQAARMEAQRILAFDPQLEKFTLLKQQVEKLGSTVHWE